MAIAPNGRHAPWVPLPAVSAVLVRDYTGDGTANREIDLGDDYDEVWVFQTGNLSANTTHCVGARAVRTTYSNLYEIGATTYTRATSGTFADSLWQGKMTGASATKIKTGSGAGTAGGTNENAATYRIMAFKFAGARS